MINALKSGASKPSRLPDLSLKTRLYAWWEGYDLSGLKTRRGRMADDAAARRDQEAEAEAEAAETEEENILGKAAKSGENRWGKPLWTPSRIDITEKLWGAGFSSPGGAEHISYLVRPIGLNPDKSALDLSAGLGGGARSMATEFGCWVNGLESSPLLAAAGMERSRKAGLEKRAPVELYDPEHFSYPRRVDAILYKEGMFAVHDKEQLFDGIEEILKPKGHLLITDYVLAPKVAPDSLADWTVKEPLEPNLWTLDRMKNAFAQRNLDLRISEDITNAHQQMIKTLLYEFTQYLAQISMTPETRATVLREAELWAGRVTAMNEGLRCYRFYALKPGE